MRITATLELFEDYKETGIMTETRELDEFETAYLECALWSSTDGSDESGGNPLDDTYSIEDIHPDALTALLSDCDGFRELAADLLDEAEDDYHATDEQNGHDLWLTQNGHGAGFWDRGYGEVGDKLSDVAKTFGSVYLYVGDDGVIHV